MEPAPSRGLPVWLLLVGALGAIIGFSWSAKDYVAAAALAAVSLAGLWGYYVGALRLLGLFVTAAIAWACASPVGQWISPVVERRFQTPPGTTQLISSTLGGGIVLGIVMVVVAVASRRLLRDRPELQAANRLLGFGVGGIQGTACVLLLLNGVLIVEPHAKQRINATKYGDGSVLARVMALQVVDIAQRTRRSTIASLVKAYNPFETVPQLRDLQRAAAAIGTPPNRSIARRSSNSQRVPRKSEVRRAIESLAQDPQLRRLVQSKQPLDNQTAASLLNHPGIAKLLEQPDLMNQLSEALDDLRVQPIKHAVK